MRKPWLDHVHVSRQVGRTSRLALGSDPRALSLGRPASLFQATSLY